MNIWLSEEFITLSEECNTNFILRQLQEKYLAEKKNSYFAFADLEKAFYQIPRDVIVGSEETSRRRVVS